MLQTVERLLYSYRDVAVLLSLSETSIKRYVARGELPAITIGGSRRIARESLDRFISEKLAGARHE